MASLLSTGLLSTGLLSTGLLSTGLLSTGLLSTGRLSPGLLSTGLLSPGLAGAGSAGTGPGRLSSAIRSVQFREEPPRPWTKTAGSAFGAPAGADRTKTSPVPSVTGAPGQCGTGPGAS